MRVRSFGWALSILMLATVQMSLSAADSDADLRVMSFNIRYGTANDGANHWDVRKEFLTGTIRAFDPDLLGTQETLAFQRNYIQKNLEGYEPFGVGREDGEEIGEFAALFYRRARFEKLDGGNFWLSKTPDKRGSKSWDSSLPRIATWVKLADRKRAGSPPILFLNTHFDHRGTQARMESARLLRKHLETVGKGCSIVVTGDFNTDEGSEPYAVLFEKAGDSPAQLIDTFRATHAEKKSDEGTFSDFVATRTNGPRIDWIGVSRDWKVVEAAIDRTAREGRTPSDHFPVTAVLRP